MSSSKPKYRPQPVKVPDDPDPVPMAQTDTTPEVHNAALEERKRIGKSYGRHKTILAGDTSQDNSNKKTILGG